MSIDPITVEVIGAAMASLWSLAARKPLAVMAVRPASAASQKLRPDRHTATNTPTATTATIAAGTTEGSSLSPR